MPTPARHHAAARFEGERAATFVRAMTGWVRGRALSPTAFAWHFFDRPPRSPGVRPLHEAAKAVGDTRSLADLHAATDHVADAMQAVGLDRFHAFVREAAAQALLDAEARQPGLIHRAMNGEVEAVTAVREIVAAQGRPGEGIETYSDEERALVREMGAAGHDDKAIQAALDKHRAGDPARTRRELMAARHANTPWIPREVLERIPVEWGLGRPNNKAEQGKDGWRWEDPANKDNGVRIDQGNPNLSNRTQRMIMSFYDLADRFLVGTVRVSVAMVQSHRISIDRTFRYKSTEIGIPGTG